LEDIASGSRVRLVVVEATRPLCVYLIYDS